MRTKNVLMVAVILAVSLAAICGVVLFAHGNGSDNNTTNNTTNVVAVESEVVFF